jgi:hypothetical protein
LGVVIGIGQWKPKENTWEKLSARSMCELVYAVKEQPALDKKNLQIAVALTPDNVKHIAHSMDCPGFVLACGLLP